MKRSINYLKSLFTAILLFGGVHLIAQDQAPAAAEINQTMYEKLGVSPTILALFMIIFTAILIGFVISLAGSAKNILEYKRNKMNGTAKILFLLTGLFSTDQLLAAEVSNLAEAKYVIPFPDEAFWTFFVLDIILVMIILYLTGIMRGVLSEYHVPEKLNIFARWNKKMTDAVPLESESSILLDHDYDGIRELDNNLPPWWKYGFYVTIVWSFGYLIYYNVLNAGPLQEQEFLAEMEEGERQVAEYKRLNPVLITAENVTLLEDPSSISKGQKIYTDYCQTCHMEKGRGGAGPNLTDKNWIYGGDIKTVFKTISDGTVNGMAKWGDIIKADEIQFVASYVLSLSYVAPPEGKVPEGKILTE